ncbi:MAG: methionyl-tRNA formyltransferase [Alphaproteobacteria bacterium]|nr:methionyl-tRNA formyltransferase [Alphaproteobacteria bacterium]
MQNPRRVIFMGTPQFAVPTLRALIGSPYRIAAVYTAPPRPAGRGQKEQITPVAAVAQQHGLPVHTPPSLKNPDAQAAFAAHAADIAVVAAYGLLLPRAVLEAPPLGCWNVHPSLLPRWRGAAPIQRALMAGDRETGVCIMRMDEGLDTGDILRQERFSIPEEMDGGGLEEALAALGARLMLETLDARAAGGGIPRHKQGADGVTYAPKITREDGRINWNEPAETVRNRIRALSPAPGAFFTYENELIKVFASVPCPGVSTAAPGTVLDGRLCVACGNGTALRLLEVQRPGKKRMAAAAMLQGFAVPEGARLG